jgi:hypothetical protein
MAYSKKKLKSSGDKASPFCRPFCIGNFSDKNDYLYGLYYEFYLNLTIFRDIPNYITTLYITSFVSES